MKRTILMVVCIVVLTISHSYSQQRLVLLEEFNGPCEASVVQNPILNALVTSGTNSSRICMIKYYLFGGEALYLMTAANDTIRKNYYNIPGIPIIRIDGFTPYPLTIYPGSPMYLTQEDLDSAMSEPSPFKMSVKSQLNTIGDSITLTVKVKAVAPYSPPEGIIKLRTARCKSIVFYPSWPTGENNIVNSVRNMYPDANGITISGSWAVGDSQTYVISGPVLKETNWFNTILAKDSFAVAWIQNDNDRKIVQSAKEGLEMSVSAPNVNINKNIISNIQIIPNPAKEQTTIQFNSDKASSASIDILDMSGKIVYSFPMNIIEAGLNIIPIRINLPIGTYTVSMQTLYNIKYTQILSIIK
jgi:hypothetical protein